MFILNCDNLISSCCQDYTLARNLSIINNVLGLIRIIVPIILLIMMTINFIQLTANPEEKKSYKKVINKMIAAVIVFFIPTIVNAVLHMLPNSMDINACLTESKRLDELTKNNEIVYQSIDNDTKKSIINNPDDYERGVKKPKNNDDNNNTNDSNTTNNTDNTNTTNNNNITSDGSILLIAGHAYSPYCETGGLGDCRGPSPSSGYAEEEETRKLVKLVKSHLDKLGVKSDIANALMAGDNDQMNKSFFIESRLDTELFNQFDWSKYKFVLEVHFNATDGGQASGTLLCKKSSSYSTEADDDIVNAVISHTGNPRLGDSIQALNNVNYFTSRDIPITYLETEFYDNADAMSNYTSQMDAIAHDIAVAIKNHYG